MSTMESPAKTTEDTTFHRVIKSAQERAPSSRQMRLLVGWLTAGVAVLMLGVTAFFGTAITLAFVVPLVVLFSPVLIPLGIVLFLATAGTVAVLGSGLVVVSAISWTYNYCRGRDPPGADRVDAARERIICTARDFKEWASNYSNQMRAAPSA